jgi:hypothetical protein
MRVEINFNELIQTIETILQKEVKIDESAQQVCGLSCKEYSKAINFSKLQCLDLLVVIMEKFPNLAKNFVASKLPNILN